jgi:uncharacterized protein (DUF362 family)
VSRVAVVARPGTRYVLEAPFSPPNPVYAMVERALADLGLDAARAGTPDWNPLGDLVQPGDRVLIKPNFVTSKNFEEHLRGERLAASSTHGSVLRPILDYVMRAAGPHGRVTVVDTPVEGCNLDEVVDGLGVKALLRWYAGRGQRVGFIDLRHFRVVPRLVLDDVRRAGRSLNLGLLLRRRLPGDPLGYQPIDLAERSFFAEVERRAPRFAFHRSHKHTPVPHHSGGRHRYSVPRSVLDADVVINIPKLKTHKKSGVTVALKSVIGLTNQKYWLPHYTLGTVDEDGDEFPFRPPLAVRIENQLQRLPLPFDHSLIARAPKVAAGRGQNGLLHGYILEGSWQGNDTIWRTTLDLNQILFYADRHGRLTDTPQRRYLALVDGIIAGEGEGPLAATPRPSGVLIAGTDPVLVDVVATRRMGFDLARVPTVARALANGAGSRALLLTSRLDQLEVHEDGPPEPRPFVPPETWPDLLGGPAWGTGAMEVSHSNHLRI